MPDKPFIAVDCGAIPKELANSILFGHVKGAFTGAENDKTGYFEEANGGTLFLDEVGNLPHENQVKILRALQERIISKTGGTRQIKVDVRLISAANDNILTRVKAGDFREDLYHRLNGFKILLPPLRKRREDIMDFVWYFIKQANNSLVITEKEIIHNALSKTNNNKSKAARLLKIDRKTLYYKIRLYGLEA